MAASVCVDTVSVSTAQTHTQFATSVSTQFRNDSLPRSMWLPLICILSTITVLANICNDCFLNLFFSAWSALFAFANANFCAHRKQLSICIRFVSTIQFNFVFFCAKNNIDEKKQNKKKSQKKMSNKSLNFCTQQLHIPLIGRPYNQIVSPYQTPATHYNNATEI